MTPVAIVCLTLLAFYLASRWLASSAENVQLRARNAALKRELARRTR
ncbi:MAG: hypothetical protein ACREUL_09160 [Steroidobacteraceae bacterium]